MRAASHFTDRYRTHDVNDSILYRIVCALIILFFVVGLVLGPDSLNFLTSWTY